MADIGYEEMGDLVWEGWGIRLLDWQHEDLFKFLKGGIFSWSIPTDHGKSMGLEILACLRLMEDGNRRFIMVKINEDAAKEVAQEVCRRLAWIASNLKVRGAPLFPHVAPAVTWRDTVPWGISKGFDVVGRDHRQRNVNPSFRSATIGSRDLQGKRGDTAIDDVERQQEAESAAYRHQLRVQVEGVIRTLEDKSDALWMMVGTAFHADSIYDHVTRSLDGLPIPHERIVRPLQNPDGGYLWPERAAKVQVHRATMSKTAFAAAYELQPLTGTPLTRQQVQQLCREPALPRVDNERQFRQLLAQWAVRHTPRDLDPWVWRNMVEQRLDQELAFYVGWDPATVGDWAVAAYAVWGEDIFVLRSRLSVGDTWDQVLAVRDAWLPFPSATVVVETNGQQRAFQDLAKQDATLHKAEIVIHQTSGGRARSGNKHDSQIGIPALMAFVRNGMLHEPFGDALWADQEFHDLELEITSYGPTSHPHILPALWFGWRRHRKLFAQRSAAQVLERRAADVQVERNQVLRLPPVDMRGWPQAPDHLRESSRRAWGRRHQALR